MSDDTKDNRGRTLGWLRGAITLAAIILAGAHLLWPHLAIDLITLTLLIVALIPWLAPIFKSLEFPGGWKVEFQDLKRAAERAEQAGLLAPVASTPTQLEYTFQRVAEEDPNLALAGLRIEIEKRLVALAERSGIDAGNRGIGPLLRMLSERQVLGQRERAVLADLTGLLNSAVHGASVDSQAASWAIEIGQRLLPALDEIGGKRGPAV